MKKIYIFLGFIVLAIMLLMIKYNYDYKIITNDPCVTGVVPASVSLGAN